MKKTEAISLGSRAAEGENPTEQAQITRIADPARATFGLCDPRGIVVSFNKCESFLITLFIQPTIGIIIHNVLQTLTPVKWMRVGIVAIGVTWIEAYFQAFLVGRGVEGAPGVRQNSFTLKNCKADFPTGMRLFYPVLA